MSTARPQLVTLDDLGAEGRPVHVLQVPTLGAPKPVNLSVASFFVILILTRGSGSAWHQEQLDLRGGDIHFVPAGMRFQLLQENDLAGWVVGFNPLFLRSFGAPPWTEGAAGRTVPLPIPEQSLLVRGFLRLNPGPDRWERINRLVVDLEMEARGTAWEAQHAAQAFLTLLLVELLRELQEHAPQAPLTASSLVRDALAFVEQNCLEPVSLAEIAAAVSRTPSHLANAVRRETGLTVGDWLREHRMVEARRRLRGTDASVETIAAEVGYADVTHFIRTFRRVHGLTPKVWRDHRRPAEGNPS